MSSKLRRISRFWIEGGHLSEPPTVTPDPTVEPGRYLYGLEGDRAFRFRYAQDRQAWLVDAPDRREAIRSTHPLVKAANAAKAWPDDDEDQT